MIEGRFKRIVCTTYINKMHILFSSLFHRNSTVRAWLRAILKWVTLREVSWKACEWEQNMLKKLMLIYGISRQS